MIPTLDGKRLLQDLDTLAQIGVGPGGGLDRIAYSASDQEARVWVETQMWEIGLKVHTDQAGNSIRSGARRATWTRPTRVYRCKEGL